MRNDQDAVAFLPLSEVAGLVERSELSPVELVDICYKRIEKRKSNGAFVRLTEDQARSQAVVAEKDIHSGDYRGPLHGIPIAHKDLWDVGGVRTEAASKIYEGRIPSEDATVVRKLREAGAISLGKTTLPELAFGDAGLENPWHPDATPGGSSTGSAIAVTTGLCYGATGSDTGGSIRVPATLCGVVGFKPTYGRISRYGGVPHAWTLDHAGPLARTVEDVAVMLEAMSGYDHLDPSSVNEVVPDFRQAARNPDIRGLRLGVIRNYSFDGCAPDVTAAGEDCVARAGKLGADVREVEVSHTEMELPAWGTLVFAEFAAAFAEEYAKHGPEAFGPIIQSELKVARSITAVQYLKAQQMRRIVQEAYAKVFEEVDVLITAAWASDGRWYNPDIKRYVPERTDALILQALSTFLPEPGPDVWGQRMFFPAHSLTGSPALVLPVGFNEAGLPIGIQIIGRAFEEERVLEVAAALEADLALGISRPPE